MTKPKKEQTRVAGYVRVSSKDQVDGESLSTQKNSIKLFAKQHGWKLTKIYADEGISGGSVSERHALLQCLHDGRSGKFTVLIIYRLSRFGRNARELLNNHDELEKAGIQIRSISEGIDFGNKYGKAMLGMFAVMAELEREIIRETMLENRIARGQKGIPTSGSLPFGRTFNRETGQWELDQEAARHIRWAAQEFLKGRPMRDISEALQTRHGQPLSYAHLINVLSKRSGDTWTVNFQDKDPITYKIPRLLDEHTISQVKERLQHNKTEVRSDVKKYVLTGFIRCEFCGMSLSGQTQINKKTGTEHKYYNHINRKGQKCKAFNSIPLYQIENAVFQTIFENIVDAPAFERAIAESLPDEKLIKSLDQQVKTGEKELKRIEKELDKLVDIALAGTLGKATIKKKEQALLKTKAKVLEELEAAKQSLRTMPDLEHMKKEADKVRRELLEQYSGPERLAEMTFDEKKALLYFLFGGKDPNGKPYGIYVNKQGSGPGQKVDYFMYGRVLTGLRTMKGNDIDYQDEKDYKLKSSAFMRQYQ